LYPTDTVWGIGCDATNADAVRKVYKLKKRKDSKSMIILVAEEKDVLKYTAAPDLRLFDHLRQLPNPTTVIYEQGIGLAENLLASNGSIAIRITRDPFCRYLVKRFRHPIVSTSANISGDPTPVNFKGISLPIRNGVSYIVRYRQDDPAHANPSTIIRWNKDATVTILRS
jgi:L-threonylcarbamoyladenylate synthase